MKKNNKDNGFMVIEVLIAASIITVSILAATAVAEKSIYVSRQAFHATQASFLLEEGAEIVRTLRDNNWTNISSLSLNTDYYPAFVNNNWIVSTTPNTVDVFTRKISIANVSRDNTTKDISGSGTIDPNTKLVTVTVSWSEGGSLVNKTLQFYIINIFP